MSNDIDLATALFGNKRIENGVEPTVKILTGTAVSNSSNGTVKVIIDGVTTGEEYDGELQDNVIELDTNPNVKEGDIVQITAYGGVSNSMIVTGVIGNGDTMVLEVDTVKQDVEKAQEKANALADELDATNAKVTDLSTEVGTVGTKVENAVTKANDSLLVATEAKQTATAVQTTAESAYDNAGEALRQSSTAKQTADAVSTTLSTEYSKTGEDTTYSTKTELTQTASDLTLKITEGDDDAKKVATNYLKFNSSDGLVVGDMTSSTLKGNTQITSSGVNVRSGTTTMASFGASKATIGASNQGQIIIEPSSITIKDKTRQLFNLNSTTFKDGTVFSTLHSGGTTLISVPFSTTTTSNQIILGFKETSTGYLADIPSIGLIQDKSTFDFIVKTKRTQITTNSLTKNNGEIYGETVLFNNASQAMSGAITLSQACTGFTYLDIYCKDNDGMYVYTKVYQPTVGKIFRVTSMNGSGSNYWIRHKAFKINSATNIDTNPNSSSSYDTGLLENGSHREGDYINIVRVVGIK